MNRPSLRKARSRRAVAEAAPPNGILLSKRGKRADPQTPRKAAYSPVLKQGLVTTATRVQELMKMIQRARLIENLEIEASRVGVGTETTLRPSEENGTPGITFWILGEGDGNIAPGVLSYRAPLARPLLGKEVGAEVELEMPEGPRRYRVESIRRRLPGDPASI